EAQVNVFNETFNAFTYRASVIKPDGSYRDGGYLMGVTWWCVFDWYSHQHPNGFQSMGLYRMNRDTLKLAGDVLRQAYTPFYNIGGTVTGIESDQPILNPDEYNLEQNYPNPFNPVTIIKYYLPVESKVKLKIFDVLGNEIAMIINENISAGNHEVKFNSSNLNLSSGIYFYRFEAGEFSLPEKMVLLIKSGG